MSIDCGIYLIRNKANDHLYAGSAVRLKRRLRDHQRQLLQGGHVNKHLQNAWLKHGANSFEFSIIQAAMPSELLDCEQFWIDLLRPEYNICRTAGSTLGHKHSKEARLRMSQAPKTAKARANMSLAAKARVFGNEYAAIAPMLRANAGNKYRLGIQHSKETKIKMSASSIGRQKSPEHRAKLAAHLTRMNKQRASKSA